MLAAGLSVAGLSPGIASPSLATAVSLRVTDNQQPHMNTFINAGTSAGIILSVPVLLFLPGGWRAACLLFSGIALVCLLPILRFYLTTEEQVRDKLKAAGEDCLARPCYGWWLLPLPAE